MYPIAGLLIWAAIGAIVGFVAGKATNTSGAHGLMANTGVGTLSAVVAGFIGTFFFRGERSDDGFWGAIVIAAGAAIVCVALFRTFFPKRVATLR